MLKFRLRIGLLTYKPYICSVKFFALIFSFYFFALALMPCNDQDGCTYQGFDQSTSATTGHSDHDNDGENCPPFCACACCGHSITSIFIGATFYNLVPIVAQDFPIYDTSFTSEVYLTIWQPPKIS